MSKSCSDLVLDQKTPSVKLSNMFAHTRTYSRTYFTFLNQEFLSCDADRQTHTH